MKRRGFELVTTDGILKTRKNIPNSLVPDRDDHLLTPKKGSKNSAGYDFFNPLKEMTTIESGQTVMVATNVKAYMLPDEVLLVDIRSSIAIKKGLVLANTIGIIDSDYYDNKDNEGNILLALKNTTDKPVKIAPKEKLAQGMFTVYLPADEGNTEEERTGGVGSTDKK